MRLVVCLLFALTAGCGTYAVGAVLWSAADPEGAGVVLLFTIPIAIAAAAMPALLGVLVLIFRCDWQRSTRTRTATTHCISPSPTGVPAQREVEGQGEGERQLRPFADDDEPDLSFA